MAVIGKQKDSAPAAVLPPGQRGPRTPKTAQANAKPESDSSRKALHLCLKRIKAATGEAELRLLTEELQRILFHRQYQNAED